MANNGEWRGSDLVGRAMELDRIEATLRGGAHAAHTLVVSGDAGVGKTALVGRACSQVDPAALVLAGECLPLAAINLPFFALARRHPWFAARGGNPPTRVRNRWPGNGRVHGGHR